jgi:hypothetical protein
VHDFDRLRRRAENGLLEIAKGGAADHRVQQFAVHARQVPDRGGEGFRRGVDAADERAVAGNQVFPQQEEPRLPRLEGHLCSSETERMKKRFRRMPLDVQSMLARGPKRKSWMKTQES